MKMKNKSILKSIEKVSIKTLSSFELRNLSGGTDDLWEWRKNIEDGMIDRR